MVRRLPHSLSGLRAYEAFARHGAMTAAAEELCVTHGAVSRQVRGLERQLGVRLVEGPRHRLRLTEAGRDLAVAAGAAFDLIAAALPGSAPTRELVVSCFGTLAMKWLIPRLPGFLASAPGVAVRIVESHAPVDFAVGGLHAAIRIDDGTLSPALRKLPFMAHHQGPVLSPALLATVEGDPERVLALPRLHSETFRAAWTQWGALSGAGSRTGGQDLMFEHNSYMLEAAAAGLGVAVTPWAFASGDIERGRLVAPFGFEPLDIRYVYLRPRLGENEAAEAFGDWLRQEGRRIAQPPPPVRLGG